jgi:hypothetical protein
LYEELLADADATLPSVRPGLRIAQLDAKETAAVLPLLEMARRGGEASDLEVRRALRQGIAEYAPAKLHQPPNAAELSPTTR